jgi:hypothetical protein
MAGTYDKIEAITLNEVDDLNEKIVNTRTSDMHTM